MALFDVFLLAMSQALDYPSYSASSLPSPLSVHPVCIWYKCDSPAALAQVLEDHPGHYLKSHHCTWYDYDFEDTVIINELGHSSAFLGYHIKQWTGNYSFSTYVRGRKYYLKPAEFIISSLYTPEEIWKDEDYDVYDCLMERFAIVNKTSL